ncbi:TetR/AcrR family transcriptional regulator [Methylocella sp.]|uniref:TetR/AcrR family transcriptional regulator n=1 Tax=Methylocella sp. TaxID=1978226 RepID=UPI003782F254
MARYEKGHKAETHRRVVEIAAQRFRAQGVDGVGVASLMADAGLTHGGFYAHFASKEALVKEALLAALAGGRVYDGAEGAPLDLGAFIDQYLSPSHRDKPGSGCALAALAPELSRRPRATRTAFAKDFGRLAARVASGLPEKGSAEDRLALAYGLYGQMSGVLQLARVVTDKALSDRILAQGRDAARSFAGLAAVPAAAPAPAKIASAKAAPTPAKAAPKAAPTPAKTAPKAAPTPPKAAPRRARAAKN